MKKIAVLMVVFITAITLCGCSFLYQNKEITVAGTEYSPDNKYTVTFQMVGAPVGFGSTAVKIIVTEEANRKILKVIDTSIQDDGGVLREANWNVTWQEDSVKITLKGSEQKDAVYVVMLY